MLKRLELWGFKSFADKTVFEFGQGITAIVGPNGSGKSNVVDAIRWVLGEQSAKSLRGKEMADCIFHGSGTRKGLGFAEVTVVIDNRRRYLRFDGDEVAITRRVYRSGESEYSINRKPARLRDIKELLVGTGTSSQTYSIIEQGRVDALLQASPRERRLIFEEASGIRGFKLKKQEALNKLAKVEQNLTRLNDILDEVRRRLKTVRSQASKAERYRELSQQLRELRLQLGLVDYVRLRDQLTMLEDRIRELSDQAHALEAKLAAATSRELELDGQLEELDRTIRAEEAELSDTRQQIARLESTIQHERARCRELEAALEQSRHRWLEARAKCRELTERLTQLEETYRHEHDRIEGKQRRLSGQEQALQELLTELRRLDDELAERRAALADEAHELTRCRNEIAALESQQRTLESQRDRYRLRAEQLQRQLQELDAETSSLRAQLDAAQNEAAHCQDEVETIEQVVHSTEETLAELRQQQAELAAVLRGCESKLEVYRNLDQEQDQLLPAVRELMEDPELRDDVIGVLGELIEADVATAQLVDRVLGSLTQALVVRNVARFLERLEPAELAQTIRLVEAAATDVAATEAPQGAVPLSRLVSCTPAARCVVDRLLGSVFVADRFDPVLAGRLRPGQCLVVRDGLVVAWNGSYVLGRMEAEGGMVSRRAVMRELEAERDRLRSQLANEQRRIAQLEQELHTAAARLQEARRKQREAADRMSELERAVAQRQQQCDGVRDELALLHSEMDLLGKELDRLSAELAEKRSRERDQQQQEQRLREAIAELQARRELLVQERESRQVELQDLRVALAQERERLRALERELNAARQDLAERQRIKREALAEMARIDKQRKTAERALLIATAQVAELYAAKDQLVRNVGRLIAEREALRAQRHELATEVEALRRQQNALREELTEQQLRHQDLEHRRSSLVERILEDYEVDLRELAATQQPPQAFDYEAASQEARRLKKRIQSLGSVNLEALSELEELEQRERTLQEQRQDLLSAQASLLEIIDRINEDSKRLFLETLNSVRQHFQELFRKLFGGGKADIVLEDPNDVLESGVEIIAKPPGKELRSISLLSGGEKTLTAVALLLAIFRSKPSPFCILDEVDAALDEANIDRFTAVLREFLDRSQFILITHSKKTMLAADVLYGVTMQESGVSKRISVRLEDINEAGEIRPEALRAADQEAAA